ncbi:DUF2975 domain-containing protein [uncultured Jatrophihabitans sp.]|uniref:DUF2975 domain-containing protein n=1 Tax=uncultured Jatrophihabitans sp. TaxID=1610747 RepID=UPI0035C94E2A
MKLAIPMYCALAAVLAICVVAQAATLLWFTREHLDAAFGSRRSQWGLGLLFGAVAVEAICIALWRVVALSQHRRSAGPAAQRWMRVIATAAAAACAVAVWLVIVIATWPGRVESTFVIMFVGGAVIAAGIGLLAIVAGRALVQAADNEASTARLQAELDAVI